MLVYEEKDIGFYVAISARRSRRKFILIDAHDHQTSEVSSDRRRRAAQRRRASSSRASIGHEYSVEHHGDQLIITTNSRRRGRLPHRRGAGRRPAAWRTGASSFRTGPGCLILDTIALPRPHGAARARGRPAAHRRAPPRRRRRARHRLRRGGLFARHLGRLRVRHDDAALHLFVDDDAGRDLRLRHGDARAHAAQAPGGAERARPGRLRDAPPLCARPPTARPCRCRSSIARTRRSTARRRCSSTATAPTASRSPPRSRPRGCRSSIAASSTPSPTSAAARTRAIAGTPTASSRQKVNTFTDFIAAGEYLVAQGLTRRGRIVANGGSAGGMLMGVVANMAPELFLGIIADVPFVDVLNTMLDKDLPLTPPEWPEWGNPITRRDEFETIHSLQPLRERRGEGLSAHLRLRRPHRSARHLLGAGQVGRAPARARTRPTI